VPLRLVVDGPRWRAHVGATMAAAPGTVPVVKGNGYGFGRSWLAREAAAAGADTIAVGTYPEAPEALATFGGDVLVLTPWRPFEPAAAAGGLRERRLVHTVSRVEDLLAVAETGDRPPVVVEVLTSMRRHGIPVARLSEVVPVLARLDLRGWALHLPLAGDSVAEAARLAAAALRVAEAPVLVSHVPATRLAEVGPEVRLRTGTGLWLGDPTAMHVEGVVLDRHHLSRGEPLGYRQRRARRAGTLLVVAGGTSHGIALTAPSPAALPRQRAVALARGGLDALGLARSPFQVAGRFAWFAEPPHMQCSMVWCPDDVDAPQVGDALRAQVRYTTVLVDEVVERPAGR
jgi:hypothetical protein